LCGSNFGTGERKWKVKSETVKLGEEVKLGLYIETVWIIYSELVFVLFRIL